VDPLLGAYIAVTALWCATPGSTTAVVVRNVLGGGRSAGLAAAFGAATGNTSHATAAGLGLTVVLARWPLGFTALQFAGGAYLAWLGAASLFRSVVHADGGVPLIESSTRPPSSSRIGSFRQGLAVNLLNPSIPTFYLVVVPSFIPSDAPRGWFGVLAVIHVATAFTLHSAWAVGLDRLRRTFRPPAARRLLEVATGVALLGLAAHVLTR
jgi:threonine/homoserine/homoserine lactone efflux protein